MKKSYMYYNCYVLLNGYWLNDFYDMIQSTNARTNLRQCLDFVKENCKHQPNATERCEYLFHFRGKRNVNALIRANVYKK